MADIPLGAEDLEDIDFQTGDLEISIDCEDHIENGQFVRRVGTTTIDLSGPDGTLEFLVGWELKLILGNHWKFTKDLIESTPPFEEEEGPKILHALEARLPLYDFDSPDLGDKEKIHDDEENTKIN